ncbi:MAG: exonuclease SbcCD subunit D [Candidatus Fimimonas sp.]
MKIIHTADIHLDSPLVGVADGKLRRSELLQCLANLSQYADNVGAQAVIVAGDLFDDKFVSAKTVDAVSKIICASKATWFVLKGNHGDAKPYEILQERCPVRLFGENWQSYTMGNVAIWGRELGNNDEEQWQNLHCDGNFYNVVALHCDVDDDSYGVFDKVAVSAQPINYVALGHRHAFKQMRFGKVKACYSGVLETRGFDENTQSGFVVIDTDADKISFVPQHLRRVENVCLDVSDVDDSWTLKQRIIDSISQVSPKNYLNFQLVGKAKEDLRAEEIAREVLQGRFFALRVKDETTPDVDFCQLQKEVSLRGEFVKLAMQIQDETQREAVLKLGLAALAGEL